jgi:hypothetical protein
MGPNRVGADSSPEIGKLCNFRNVVSLLLEYPKKGKVQESSNSQHYTPSSEPFTIRFLGVAMPSILLNTNERTPRTVSLWMKSLSCS